MYNNGWARFKKECFPVAITVENRSNIPQYKKLQIYVFFLLI